MRILLIGDSLVRGSVGVNWVNALALKRPGWQIENAGVNGETLTKISQRLDKKLQHDCNYDRIILEAGANDILIPSLAKRGFLFRLAHQQLLKNGFQPLDNPHDFEIAFRHTITLIRQRCNARVILTTLGCLNEDLSFPLNTKRNLFNEIIRDIAWDMDCRLADPGHLFDELLEDRPTRNYFLENFFKTTWSDKWQCSIPGGADSLSQRRGLFLTIDGLHLNSLGARLFRNEIEKQIIRS